MISLYHNIIYWDYSISTGEYLAWYQNPFGEYSPDPEHIFKVQSIDFSDWTATLEVAQSTFYEVGEVLTKIPVRGLKRVKFTG